MIPVLDVLEALAELPPPALDDPVLSFEDCYWLDQLQRGLFKHVDSRSLCGA